MDLARNESPVLEASAPAAEYARRLKVRQEREARLACRYGQLKRGRNVVFGLVIALAWAGDKETLLTKVILLLPPFALLQGLDTWRKRTARSWKRAAGSADFYERRLACVEGRWAGTGEPGTRFQDDNHPCAPDLDLFGTGCLFELMNTSRTRKGEEILADWLLAPAPPCEVEARQRAVAELRPGLDLREDLAELGSRGPATDRLDMLAAWGRTDPGSLPIGTRPAAWGLMALTLAALAGWAGFGQGPAPLLAVFCLNAVFAFWLRGFVRRVLEAPKKRVGDLRLLQEILIRVERAHFASPRLKQLQAALMDAHQPASYHVARLVRLTGRLEMAALTCFLLGTTRLALAVAAWRRTWGVALTGWLTVVGEFEALLALAAYAYDNPADPFPEVIEDGPRFEAQGLGHPLLPRERCVRNDLRVTGDLRLLMVSGSNMAGKSTLLRSVGINTVLALAGAPVRAERLLLSPLVVGATLRIQDSLHAGRSRFYAEVLRVRQLLDLARGATPVLFLLDELFQGTNSHDRRVGAEAIVRSLLDAGAVGLVTTHDLALTEIADRLAPRAVNVHFLDGFENGAMTFDYRMRPGVVPKSNALALMRAVGIEV